MCTSGLTNNPKVKITATFEGCGDCALCQAMASENPPGFEELQKLFETENIMRHVRSQLTAPEQQGLASSKTVTKKEGGKAEKTNSNKSSKPTTKKS